MGWGWGGGGGSGGGGGGLVAGQTLIINAINASFESVGWKSLAVFRITMFIFMCVCVCVFCVFCFFN